MDMIQEYNKRSFQHKIATRQEMIDEFTKTEIGADETFKNFPHQAKEIVYKAFEQAQNERELIEMLDNHNGLKDIFGAGSDGYVKEVDAIVRFWKWYVNEEVAA